MIPTRRQILQIRAVAEATASTPEDLAELLRKDTAKWAPIVKQAGIRVD